MTGAGAAVLSTLQAGSRPAALKTSSTPRTRTSFYGKGSEAESTRSDWQAQGLGSRLHGAFVMRSGGIPAVPRAVAPRGGEFCSDFLLVQRMQPPQGPVQGLVPQVVLLVQSLEHTIRFAASISS